MRAGGCSIQQALTAETGTVVKQAVTLARRRGHAQVTPLHVASAMLSSQTGLFKTTCLKSHPSPHQCNVLDLCFSVALNRLPASSPSASMGSASHQVPSISNALVAALKRAQAHQRRGSIESQQPPVHSVRIELDQLIISILDDPSVSRVMKEAGFSSSQVKSSVEQTISLELCSHGDLSEKNGKSSLETSYAWTPSDESTSSSLGGSTVTKQQEKEGSNIIGKEDVVNVVGYLASKRRRCFVIIGEPENCEEVIKGVMEKVQKRNVPEILRYVKFYSFPVSSLRNRSKMEIEQKIEELHEIIKNNIEDGGIILNLGDLDSIIDGEVPSQFQSLEDLILELVKLASSSVESNNRRFWLIGTATLQAYKQRNPNSAATLDRPLYGLHPLAVPASILRLSVITDSDTVESQPASGQACHDWSSQEGANGKHLLDTAARSLRNDTDNGHSAFAPLPPWLQQYKNGMEAVSRIRNPKACTAMNDICNKWNSSCSSEQQQPISLEKNLSFDPAGLCLNSRSHISTGQESFLYASNNGSHCSNEMDFANRFKELNSRNLTLLCDALAQKVPWQKELIPDMITTVLKCRSGMIRRKSEARYSLGSREVTWLLFEGVDGEAKEKIARELAKLVFGSSTDCYFTVSMSNYAATRVDSTEDSSNKRSRDEQACSFIERFVDAVSSNPSRVFMVEDVEQLDYSSQKGFKRAIERGMVTNRHGKEVGLGDSIIILSCESFITRSRACSTPSRGSLDLNIAMDDDRIEDSSTDELSIMELVDARINFKIL